MEGSDCWWEGAIRGEEELAVSRVVRIANRANREAPKSTKRFVPNREALYKILNRPNSCNR